MKIYTKGGDGGTTSLIGGERVKKYDARVEAYGTVDELSAQTAMLRDMLKRESFHSVDDDLKVTLLNLMSVESLLAACGKSTSRVKDIQDDDINSLEERIDAMSESLPPLRHFTVPGGHILVSQAHICRTVCRRAERAACRTADEYSVSINAMKYLNRLSDYFYILGRYLTEKFKAEETVWEP